MAKISGIRCAVFTANVANAGTDSSVYLGIGGREFHLDTSIDDFEKRVRTDYIIGNCPIDPDNPGFDKRVLNPDKNDPAKGLPMYTENVLSLPKYLRLQGSDHWAVSFVSVLIYVDMLYAGGFNTPAPLEDYLWLGPQAGHVLHLAPSNAGEREAMAALNQFKAQR